jgi:hypothetical protein
LLRYTSARDGARHVVGLRGGQLGYLFKCRGISDDHYLWIHNSVEWDELMLPREAEGEYALISVHRLAATNVDGLPGNSCGGFRCNVSD